jgi:uncharacterized protein (DUF4213/DUF364 family)
LSDLRTIEDRILTEIPKKICKQRVKEVSAGIYMSAVLTESVGCAFTLAGDAPVPHMNPTITSSEPIRGMEAIELASWSNSKVPLEKTLGYAAMNSLLNQRGDVKFQFGNPLSYLKKRFQNKRIRMVGYFAFHPEINSWTDDFKIIENKPVTDTLTFEMGKDELEGSELTIVTGVTLLNGSFMDVLSRCRDGFVVLFGPTVPFANTLLEMGVDMICGFVPEDVREFYNCVTEGRIVTKFRSCRVATISREKIEFESDNFFQNEFMKERK